MEQTFDNASCKDMSTDLFFPNTVNGYTDKQYWDVHTVCRECPVRVDCVVHSLENDLEYGIYGLPERVRKRIKAKTYDDIAKLIDETFTTLDIIEPTFKKSGELDQKRCLKCNRITRGYAKDGTNWGGRSHYCVSCHILMSKNKQKDKLLDREKPSKSMPVFSNHGELVSKKCTKCLVRKESKDFSKRPQGIGQRTSWCKECTRKNLEKWQKKQNKND